jgi:hypothetical protein
MNVCKCGHDGNQHGLLAPFRCVECICNMFVLDMEQNLQEVVMAPAVRQFTTGATRDVDTGKLDYEGFISPLVLKRFAEFMHKNRFQKDGSLRASDNWQKGIPLDAYMKSETRHFMDLWLHHRGYPDQAVDKDIEEVLCAIIFNAQGYLHELLKVEGRPTMGQPIAKT